MSIAQGQQTGLSLIELMISMTIGAFVTIGVLNLFNANSDTYNVLQAQARLQESANFGLNVMSRDLEKSGYRGCFSSGDVYFTMATEDDIPADYDIRYGLSVFNGVGEDDWTTSATTLPAAVSSVATAETDVLALRYLDNDEAYLASALTQGSEDVVVTVASGASSSIATNDLALLHDCEKATLFKVTEATSSSSTTVTFAHAIESGGNAVSGLAQTGVFGTNAAVSSIVGRHYYIAPGASSRTGLADLSLYRRDAAGASELVEGIEDLQVLVGIDSDGDGVPNQYYAPAANLDMSQAVTILLEITANSVVPVGSSESDGLLRRTYRRTVQIRNAG
ncbi:MAG: PilW family protein [Pseudomonadales bacterium]